MTAHRGPGVAGSAFGAVDRAAASPSCVVEEMITEADELRRSLDRVGALIAYILPAERLGIITDPNEFIEDSRRELVKAHGDRDGDLRIEEKIVALEDEPVGGAHPEGLQDLRCDARERRAFPVFAGQDVVGAREREKTRFERAAGLREIGGIAFRLPLRLRSRRSLRSASSKLPVVIATATDTVATNHPRGSPRSVVERH